MSTPKKSDPAISADRTRRIRSTADNDSGQDLSRSRAGTGMVVAAGQAATEPGLTEAELIAAAAELVATAMAADPVSLWVTEGIGPAAKRWQEIVEFYRPLIAHGRRHDGLHTVADPMTGRPAGVRLWLPPRADDRDYYIQIARACQQHGQQWRRLHELLDNGRPPHAHHLAVIAVHPGAHGHRFGSALLRAWLDELDAAGAASYAEATSPISWSWLDHHGFQVQETVQLPDGGPPVWRMYREPGTPYRPRPRHHPWCLAWPPGSPDHTESGGRATSPAETERPPGRAPPTTDPASS